MTVLAHQIIKKPIITEKSTTMASELSQYTFEVAKEATKDTVKVAVEAAFPNVKVTKVNMAKIFRSGRRRGTRKIKDGKKAIVTTDGHIDCFPEV